MIRAVLFDIDGVLVDSVRANAHLYRTVLEHFGFRGPSDEEQTSHNHRTFIDNLRIYAKGASEDAVQEMFDYGVSLPRDQHHDMLALMDGVRGTLMQLKSRYVLGVVTSRLHNREPSGKGAIAGLLEHFGLQDIFSVRVGFEDTANHKPNPDPLLLGAKLLGCKPGEVVYVGDAESDVQAANAAGMKMIHYADAAVPGDHVTVSLFRDLPDAIADM